jgi:hypothetical protein
MEGAACAVGMLQPKKQASRHNSQLALSLGVKLEEDTALCSPVAGGLGYREKCNVSLVAILSAVSLHPKEHGLL